MSIKYFTIIATMKNGDKWETRRHTREGLDALTSSILKDEEVVRFTVEETI